MSFNSNSATESADINGGTNSSLEEQNAIAKTAVPSDSSTTQAAMDLNVAYESLEVMRNLNLQVEFGERIDVNQCVSCLREVFQQNRGGGASPHDAPQSFRRWRRSTSTVATPCLACGSPMCSRHCCSDFYKQNITICHKCSGLFAPDLVATTITLDNYQTRMNYILEVYDRAQLILKFSAQYIDEIIQALERNTKRNNQIGLGSSATGVLAGVVGVAAAATIWTPVGPPLLIASILFGSGATAAAAGSEAVNYRCEPQQMANRILTLHSIIASITHLPAAMDDMGNSATTNKDPSDSSRPSLHWARATMNGLKPLTMGTLSAVSVVTEAREVKKTVDKMRAGNPCETAQELRRIQLELDSLLDTSTFANHLTFVIHRHLKESNVEEAPYH